MSDEAKTNLAQLREAAEAAAKEAAEREAALVQAKAKAEAAKAALEAAVKAAAPPEEAKPAPPPPPKKQTPPESGDPVTIKMLGVAREKGQPTIFDRAVKMKQCNIGTEGICCKVCSQGPCRLPITKAIKDGSEPDARIGLCGATPETIATRNLIRMVSAGSSAHSDHGLDLVETLKELAHGRTGHYRIKDEARLRAMAGKLDLEAPDAEPAADLAKRVADALLAEWGGQIGELKYVRLAPKKIYERWTALGVKPRGINREAVEIMHRTHMGVDQDYRNLLFQGVRCALADGWSASMIATELQDVLFGPPVPGDSALNLGTLSPTRVNVVVNGGYPQLAEKLLDLAGTPAMVEYAKSRGAEGFQISGVCATATEIGERRGAAAAGDYLQQELVVVTGAVEAMVVDAQCAMEALGAVCGCYHTRLLTTVGKAMFDPAKNYRHLDVDDSNIEARAEEILRLAADNFKNRGPISIPDGQSRVVVGHSVESIGRALKSNGSGPLAPLADLIADGKLKGVAGLLGCNNVRVAPGPSGEDPHVDLARALIADNILTLTTGCAAMACGRAGLLTPEAADSAGPLLAAFCRETGLPPVVHLGSCVDNSRILAAMAELAKSGRIGDMAEIPAAVAAPGWTTEQIVSTCFYFAASGVNVVLGVTLPVQGVPLIAKFLGDDFARIYGGGLLFEPDPPSAAKLVSETIAAKRAALGLGEI